MSKLSGELFLASDRLVQKRSVFPIPTVQPYYEVRQEQEAGPGHLQYSLFIFLHSTALRESVIELRICIKMHSCGNSIAYEIWNSFISTFGRASRTQKLCWLSRSLRGGLVLGSALVRDLCCSGLRCCSLNEVRAAVYGIAPLGCNK